MPIKPIAMVKKMIMSGYIEVRGKDQYKDEDGNFTKELFSDPEVALLLDSFEIIFDNEELFFEITKEGIEKSTSDEADKQADIRQVESAEAKGLAAKLKDYAYRGSLVNDAAKFMTGAYESRKFSSYKEYKEELDSNYETAASMDIKDLKNLVSELDKNREKSTILTIKFDAGRASFMGGLKGQKYMRINLHEVTGENYGNKYYNVESKTWVPYKNNAAYLHESFHLFYSLVNTGDDFVNKTHIHQNPSCTGVEEDAAINFVNKALNREKKLTIYELSIHNDEEELEMGLKDIVFSEVFLQHEYNYVTEDITEREPRFAISLGSHVGAERYIVEDAVDIIKSSRDDKEVMSLQQIVDEAKVLSFTDENFEYDGKFFELNEKEIKYLQGKIGKLSPEERGSISVNIFNSNYDIKNSTAEEGSKSFNGDIFSIDNISENKNLFIGVVEGTSKPVKGR